MLVSTGICVLYQEEETVFGPMLNRLCPFGMRMVDLPRLRCHLNKCSENPKQCACAVNMDIEDEVILGREYHETDSGLLPA